MAVTETITGKYINLRCVEEGDAEFTLAIRNDAELTKYIPKVNGDLASQRNWIRKQRSIDGDYFFIIENKENNSVGTIACYDFNLDKLCCEGGRYISYGNALENIEAMVLLYDFIFEKKKLRYIIMNVDESNLKVLNIHKKFGAQYISREKMNGWISHKLILTKENYVLRKNKIINVLYFN